MQISPIVLLGIGGFLLLALIVIRLTRRAPGAPKLDRSVAKQVMGGNYEAGAAAAVKAGDLETGYDLYLRAQQPERAAQLAQRMGKHQEAGELYERIGNKARAAQSYRQAGLTRKADELEPKAVVPHEDAPVEEPKLVTPVDRAREASLQVDEARRKGADKTILEALGQQAAEAWLAAGDVRRAAEVCRDAGLIDQAVNLYVNLLGDPGSAAPLLAARGDHARAAQLFEQAGLKERALHSWIEWSSGASDPLEHVDDVHRLGDTALTQLVEAIASRRPLDQQSMELHYRMAVVLEQHAQGGAAVPVFERIRAIAPDFRDVRQRLGGLATAPTEMAAAPGPAPVAPRKDVPEVDRADLEQMVNEAVATAVKQAASHSGPLREVVSRGVERTLITLVYAQDSAVRDARLGPSVDELRKMLGGSGPNLRNIEVHYRLGLAMMAAGRWDEAKEAFAQVDEVSPGYRDAVKRADELVAWRAAVVATEMAQRPGAGTGKGGRYTLLGELGRGAMAVVYRARDEALHREVAIKFIAEEVARDPVIQNFFAREARTAASLSHPNIVTIYDVGELDGRSFICMELVDGTTVDHLLYTQGRLKVLEAIDVAGQVLQALEYAHAKRVVHRDIKPGNLMKTKSGLVKLMDFGIAKLTEPVTGKAATVVAGTPPYMAPEQLAGKAEPRSDLFAVGAALYEMLSGRQPFEGMRRDAAPPRLRTLNPAVPKLVETAVHRSLELEAERRFASATEMLVPLRSALSSASKFLEKRGGTGTVLGTALRETPPAPSKADAAKPDARSRDLGATRTLRGTDEH